ncbi:MULTISPECIES: hypothetical protein [Acetobacter]|uniref:hypothetical protein n=1 Tax=Acetobacter TaxID=434 RepID=UPI000A75D0F6|nr:hypothetical protein [Acetobacter malorum]
MTEKEGLSDRDIERLTDKLLARLLPQLARMIAHHPDALIIERVDINTLPASLRGGQ